MLQRTRADQAERGLAAFAAQYPTAAAFATATDEQVARVTGGLGLHWRGPLLRQAAAQIAREGGTPPDAENALLALPGVGPYAAAAWLSLHRNRRAVIVDNNVARWLCRMTEVAHTAESRRKRWLRDLADRLTPRKDFRAYNYAVLDFTMLLCRPGVPSCHQCPLRSECRFGLDGAIRTG